MSRRHRHLHEAGELEARLTALEQPHTAGR
jgi:hypothetical protein